MTISYLIQFTIEDGKTEEFKKLADGFIALTQANEPNTLSYQWWVAEEGPHALLYETFTDSDGLLTHLGNVGPSLPDLLAIAPITRWEVFGDASADARKAMADLGAVYFSHSNGFDR